MEVAGAAAATSPSSRRGKADNFNYVFVSAVLTAVRTTAASAVGDGIGLRVRPSCFVVAGGGGGSDRSDNIFRADSSPLGFGYDIPVMATDMQSDILSIRRSDQGTRCYEIAHSLPIASLSLSRAFIHRNVAKKRYEGRGGPLWKISDEAR